MIIDKTVKAVSDKDIANICLSCPLKRCLEDKINKCYRFKEERKKLYEKRKNKKS